MWQERLSLLKYKGGFKAALFWLIKILLRVEVYFFYATDLSVRQSQKPEQSDKNPEESTFHFISLNTIQDLTACSNKLIEQIHAQSGKSVSQLIYENCGVYALAQQEQVVSQANICRNQIIQVDSPNALNIYLKPGDTFLGYLYTYSSYRGIGAAPLLLKRIRQTIYNSDYSRIVTHIRSTNVASLNTFKKSGWSSIGWIVTSLEGRLLLTHFSKKSAIKVSSLLDK